jgi:gamma-glutamylcysteine synthetase
MIYVRKNEVVYIDYYEIWLVLEDKFGLKYSETEELTSRWLDEVYNLRGVTPRMSNHPKRKEVG